MAAEATGTVTLRIVGINEAQRSRLPIIMTGVGIQLKPVQQSEQADHRRGLSDLDGRLTLLDMPQGRYEVWAGRDPGELVGHVHVITRQELEQEIEIPVSMLISVVTTDQANDWELLSLSTVIPHGRRVRMRLEWTANDQKYFESDLNDMRDARVTLLTDPMDSERLPDDTDYRKEYLLFARQPGLQVAIWVHFGALLGRLSGGPPFHLAVQQAMNPIEGSISVGLRRTSSRFTEDVPLWISIRKSTDSLSFDRYYDFMNWVFCNDPTERPPHAARPYDNLHALDIRRRLPFTDTDAYRNIKVATEAFVMANCGIFSDFDRFDAQYVVDQVVVPTSPDRLRHAAERYLDPLDGVGHPGVIPYLAIIRRKLADQRVKTTDIGDVMLGIDRDQVDACYGLLRRKLSCPCLFELLWSYWQEEGMLVQTMNALARRFQNVRSPRGNDPLANLEIDPLRPLNNVIWGYIQDEQHRLSVVRRNYEYDHHYGLRLAGRAVRDMRTADSRSKFLEAFHTLLSITANFYKRDDDTTIVADGFPVLNGLKEAHLILSQGAHNQFGDLPSTARIEMLMQQWILARPEFREFLPTRIMVAYPEPWMDRVDAMKKLQGWTDTSVLHFRNLAIFGEQVLLSIRYGAWAGVNDPVQATNWARYWRPEIQGYLHAYRSAAGVDLSVDVTNARIDATLPSMHLVQRLEEQRHRA